MQRLLARLYAICFLLIGTVEVALPIEPTRFDDPTAKAARAVNPPLDLLEMAGRPIEQLPAAGSNRQNIGARTAPHPAIRPSFDEAGVNAVNTWLIFGFTEGSDVGKKGEVSLFHEFVVRGTRRETNFIGGESTWGIGYSISDQAVIWLGALGAFERSGAGPDSRNEFATATSLGIGAIAGLKYQLMSRAEAPVGLSVQFSPSWQQAKSRAAAHEIIGAEFRVIADWNWVPDRWFAAMNLAYQPQLTLHNNSNFDRTSTIEVSYSLAYGMRQSTFLGGEIRYLNKFESSLFSGHVGHTLYAGPTLLLNIGENGYLGAAWSIQLESNSRSHAGRSVFASDRHQFRIKAGFSF